MGIDIDKLHGAAVCSLGLLLHGNEKTDRAAAQRAVEEGIDALGHAASGALREQASKVALLKRELDDAVLEAAKIAMASTQPDADTALGRALGYVAGLTRALVAFGAPPIEPQALEPSVGEGRFTPEQTEHANALREVVRAESAHGRLMRGLNEKLDTARRRLVAADNAPRASAGKAVS